jgi:YHS domain-containing protein
MSGTAAKGSRWQFAGSPKFLNLERMVVLVKESAAIGKADYVEVPEISAVGGYDLVSYFESSGPESGQQSLAVEYLGYTYLFSSADNRRAFVAAPEKYLQRYRGWCATTLAMGRLACPDPLNYKIENGSLLLFELVGFTNGRTVGKRILLGFGFRLMVMRGNCCSENTCRCPNSWVVVDSAAMPTIAGCGNQARHTA